MCDGKEGFTKDGITYTCCYNHYFNGSRCVQCLVGFYGNDCLEICDNGLYGERCSSKCSCSEGQFCHHITGCVIEYSGSSEIPHRGYERSSTDHTSAKSNSPLLSLTSTSPTTNIQFPQQTNIYIFAIGIVIAIFLGIIVVQFCIKLRIKRRKYTQQMSVKRKPAKEEETYNEINESLMCIEDNNERHVGKYCELQAPNQLSVPYDKIKTQANYQDKNDFRVESSCNSDSSNSNTSYLKPKTNENHSYIDVMESSTATSGIRIQDSLVYSTNDSSKVSSQYLDPVHNIHDDEIVFQSHDISDNNDAYLDVTHDTFV